MVKVGTILLVVDLIFGLYIINKGFNFITLPAFIMSIDQWILGIGGLLLIVGGFMSMKGKEHNFR